LFAPNTQTALSDKKLTSIASKEEVLAPPAEPVIQVLYLLSSASEALYLTCKNGLLAFLPSIWS